MTANRVLFLMKKFSKFVSLTLGYELLIDFNNITTETLTWAVQEDIESPK
jgi:hypothetical protein